MVWVSPGGRVRVRTLGPSKLTRAAVAVPALGSGRLWLQAPPAAAPACWPLAGYLSVQHLPAGATRARRPVRLGVGRRAGATGAGRHRALATASGTLESGRLAEAASASARPRLPASVTVPAGRRARSLPAEADDFDEACQ
jgi:hypothetical protein